MNNNHYRIIENENLKNYGLSNCFVGSCSRRLRSCSGPED